jgi:hypothetical protein
MTKRIIKKHIHVTSRHKKTEGDSESAEKEEMDILYFM